MGICIFTNLFPKPKCDIVFQRRFTMNVFLNIFPKINLHPFETFEISFETHVGDMLGVNGFWDGM